MNKNIKYLLTLPLFALTSCAYGLEEVYRGDAYNSPVFQENYYREWDDPLVNKITNKDESTHELDYDNNKVFLSYYNDEHFHSLEPDRADDEYNNDKAKGLIYDGVDDTLADYYYGPTKCLGNVDETFRYGYMSKLFDGQMFCNGDYQLARVQIDEQGFGKMFQKECVSAKYFAMNFKGSSDYTHKDNPATSPHQSEINLKIGFYLENDEGYEKKEYSYKFQNIVDDPTTRSVPTNTGDSRSANGSSYIFFGFELGDNINISRCRGISVTFDLLNDPDHNEKGLDYALMIYEIFLADSIWH